MLFKNIFKSITFIMGLVILLIGLSNFYIFKTDDQLTYEDLGNLIYEPKDSLDYIIIGDSEGQASISPMAIWQKYGYTGYNCSVPLQNAQDTYYTLEEILDLQKPKVVLLETNLFYRNFSIFDSFVNITDKYAFNIFPLLQHHNNWKNLCMSQEETKHMRTCKRDFFKGFNFSTKIIPYTDGPYVHAEKKAEKINTAPLYYIDKITRLCKKKNIQLILFSAPTPMNWTYAKHNRTSAFAEKNSLAFIDFNLDISGVTFDWSKDTRDKGDHINFFGAKKVTDYMGNYLSINACLHDHRKQSQYAYWNDDLNEYIKLTN